MGTVSLVGDVMFRQPFARSTDAATRAFHAALEAMRESDLVVANLEMCLSRRGAPVPKRTTLRQDPDLIRDVQAMGVHAVTLANNHMYDYGPDALLDTVEACRAAGLAYCGAGADLEAALAPALLRAGEVPVAVLNVATTLPIESAARPGKPGIAPIEVTYAFELDINLMVEQPGTVPVVHTEVVPKDQAAVCDRVAALRGAGHTVLVAIHWGAAERWMSPLRGWTGPNQSSLKPLGARYLADYQRPLGHALVDAGAELVFGHHSHALAPVEVYRGKAIVHSAGNFLFENPTPVLMAPESVIVQAHLGARPGLVVVPVVLNRRGFPELATGDEAQRVIGWLGELSREFGTVFVSEGDRARLVLA